MTTVKEFEDKKQEMLDIEIRAAYGYVDDENLSILHEKIKQLQPPRPTCASCDHTTKFTNCWMEPIIECGNEKSEFYCRVIYKPTVCIHHSDYDEVKNA